MKDTKDLIEAAADALDSACASDIMGEILFQGTNGKFYVGTVEFVIGEANPAYVKDVLQQIEDEGEDSDE